MTENKPFIVPLKKTRREILIQNSRFIISLAPVSSVEEAREFIQTIKKEFPDASHNVPAFVIGHGATSITHCSDDGEPSGSAGRPALAVLEGSGLGDVVVVVTRYFGGTKLGVGGLVKAYSDSVREVLANTGRAQKVRSVTFDLIFSYSFVDRIHILISDYYGQVISEKFKENVCLTVSIPITSKENFEKNLLDITRGGVVLKENEVGELFILTEIK